MMSSKSIETIIKEKVESSTASEKIEQDQTITITEAELLFDYVFNDDPEKLEKVYAAIFNAVYEKYGFTD